MRGRKGWIAAEDAGMTEGTAVRGWVLGGVVRHDPSTDSGSAHHERDWARRQGLDRLIMNGVGRVRKEDWIPAEDAG